MEVRQFDDLGYKLTTIKSDKFKTNLISVSFQSEIERDSVTKRSLLPYVMRSATKKYPSKKELNTYLETLYGGSLSATVEKRLLKEYIESIYDDKVSYSLQKLSSAVFYTRTKPLFQCILL